MSAKTKVSDEETMFAQLAEDAHLYADSIGAILANPTTREMIAGSDELKCITEGLINSQLIEEMAQIVLFEMKRQECSVGFRERKTARKDRRFWNGDAVSYPTGDFIEADDDED